GRLVTRNSGRGTPVQGLPAAPTPPNRCQNASSAAGSRRGQSVPPPVAPGLPPAKEKPVGEPASPQRNPWSRRPVGSAPPVPGTRDSPRPDAACNPHPVQNNYPRACSPEPT